VAKIPGGPDIAEIFVYESLPSKAYKPEQFDQQINSLKPKFKRGGEYFS